MSVIQVTDLQAMRLELLRLVQNDPAAYKGASDFIGDQAIKYEVFKDCYLQAHHEPTAIAKTLSAIAEAEQRLLLIQA